MGLVTGNGSLVGERVKNGWQGCLGEPCALSYEVELIWRLWVSVGLGGSRCLWVFDRVFQ